MRRRILLLALLSLAASPAAVVAVALGLPAKGEAPCEFANGFAALRAAVGESTVGDCEDDEYVNPESGAVEQRTTRGLLVWHAADNSTWFTDGEQTWVNGPEGPEQRRSGERFPWEAGDGAVGQLQTLTAPREPAPSVPAAPATAVLLGAGDIADCDHVQDAAATAALLDRFEGTVATFGDAAYDRGTPTEFARCYDPTWGRHKARTRPAVGNHEYGTAGAAGYFGYFSAAAGDPGKGYYSYQLGAWHVVVLNSNCAQVGGCGPGSPQEQWLRADLAAHPAACTLAYTHHPRFSSGPHGGSRELQALWQALYNAGAELMLAGHDHTYERFAPQDPLGQLDPARGIRQFVAGTGGRSHYPFKAAQPHSEVRHSGTYGVLKLTLHPTSYDWQFIPVVGGIFTDSGTASCH